MPAVHCPILLSRRAFFKFDPSQLPVYEFALTSETLSGRELRVFADEDLDRELSIVPGVAGVDVSGGTTEEVRILVDLDRLQATGVGLNQIFNGAQRSQPRCLRRAHSRSNGRTSHPRRGTL